MKYQQCKRCFMDTTAKGIEFDEQGVCNYCRDFELLLQNPKKRIDLPIDDLVKK